MAGSEYYKLQQVIFQYVTLLIAAVLFFCHVGAGSVLFPGQQQRGGEPAGEAGAGAGSRNWTGDHCGQSAG